MKKRAMYADQNHAATPQEKISTDTELGLQMIHEAVLLTRDCIAKGFQVNTLEFGEEIYRQFMGDPKAFYTMKWQRQLNMPGNGLTA